MNETKQPTLTIQLDPDRSRALVQAVEKRRRAYGWRTRDLARRTRTVNTAVLEQWESKARLGKPLRLDLDKALDLLAAVGIASNRVDELVAELASGAAWLVEEAAYLPGADS